MRCSNKPVIHALTRFRIVEGEGTFRLLEEQLRKSRMLVRCARRHEPASRTMVGPARSYSTQMPFCRAMWGFSYSAGAVGLRVLPVGP